MAETRFDVLGIGNALVDLLYDADDPWLARRGMVKGAMRLIDAAEAEALTAAGNPRRATSGGSAANTVVGVASFGGRAAFVGRVRDDRVGSMFQDDLRRSGVTFDAEPARSGPPTGRCLIFVTPDGERTMNTFLGAAAEVGPAEVSEDLVAAADITYLEGYLFDPPAAQEAFRTAARLAHRAGRRVALTLSDRFCVDRHRRAFLDLVRGNVDLLFANESEIVALFGAPGFEEAAEAAGEACETAILTRGSLGAVVVHRGAAHRVPAVPVPAVIDTTGAGDLFAAGFLRGWTTGAGPEDSARLGALAAAEIIRQWGPRPERRLAELR